MDDFQFDQLGDLFDIFSPLQHPPPPSKQDQVSTQTRSFNKISTAISYHHAHHQDSDKNISPSESLKKEKNGTRSDVERQRRREMAHLYQRLRILIPSKYLKGKRSISDHLEEIVEYIKDLRKNIHEQEKKRGNLLKERINIATSSNSASSSCMKRFSYADLDHKDDEDKISVKTCKAGVEVSMSTAAGLVGGMKLSKVLRLLIQEGLLINSCVSSKVNQRLLHIIESQVDTERIIDVEQLRSKLINIEHNV